MLSEPLRRHPLAAFYLLAYLWSWSLGLPLLLFGHAGLPAPLPAVLEVSAAFGPAIAALLVTAVAGGRPAVAELLRGWRRWRAPLSVQLVAWLGPAMLLAIAIAASASAGRWPAGAAGTAGAHFGGAGLVDLVLLSAVLQSAGEEPGWRGFALPRLGSRLGPLAANLALFPVWLGWHLPFFLARPEFGWFQWLAFSLGILAATFWLGWIWERSRSLPLVVGWHALINICRGLALAASTTAFLAFSNAVLLGACVIVLRWWWRRR